MVDEWHILVEFPERSFVKETPPLFDANIRERWATSKATQIIGSSCAKAARCDRWRLRDYIGAVYKRITKEKFRPGNWRYRVYVYVYACVCACVCMFIYRMLLLAGAEYLISLIPDSAAKTVTKDNWNGNKKINFFDRASGIIILIIVSFERINRESR